ncbi:TonB-dependent receptor [Crocinitomix sp.]|nr:TonB-dependent receptor [Crocinitomix sp.]
MHLKFILIPIIFCTTIAFGQSFTLSGYIRDAETGEALISSRVYNDSLKTGTMSNVYGFYSLTLPAGTHNILFSFIGKSPQKKQVFLDQDIELDINLFDNKNLETVVVTGEKKEQESSEMSTINLSMSKVKSLPVLLGEQDIIKTAQLLPGIQSGSEGSSGIYVRGGGPDQNLILLDGVPIYNANHLFGFFSVFNADAINQVKLVKGGFPAEYGGRISSVIDIRMNEGDMKKIHGEGSVGIISSKLMLNGPIIKDRTSFMISARRTYIDILAKPFITLANKQNGGDNLSLGYFFYDVNAKINHKINAKNRIYLSLYGGDDKFYLREKYSFSTNGSPDNIDESNAGMKWGNRIMALRWNHQFGSKLFMNATVNYSQYKFNTGFGFKSYYEGNEDNPNENFSFDYLSGINDWGGNLNFYYYLNPKHNIQFGVGETYHTFKPGVNQLQISEGGAAIDTSFGSQRTYAHEFFGYIQDDIKVTKRLTANIGLHFANFYVRQELYNVLQPRASSNFMLDEKSSIKLSYARTAQFLHLLSNTSIGLPTDLWVPVTDKIKPQYGNQVAIGYTRELPKGFRIGTEGYYKLMENMIEYKDGASFFGSNQDWENLVEIGDGYSYGVEVLFEKRTGKTTGWIGYTLSWTNRQFDNINDGKEFPYRYDRRHDISVVVTHKFNDKIDVGLVWVYGTGNAVTLGLQKYNSIPNTNYGTYEIEHIESRNGYRVPSYHRLDLGVNIHKPKKWGEATWSFSFYNAYNRQNPFYIDYGYIQGKNEEVLKQISLFPIIPSVSYSFKF